MYQISLEYFNGCNSFMKTGQLTIICWNNCCKIGEWKPIPPKRFGEFSFNSHLQKHVHTSYLRIDFSWYCQMHITFIKNRWITSNTQKETTIYFEYAQQLAWTNHNHMDGWLVGFWVWEKLTSSAVMKKFHGKSVVIPSK